MKKAQQYMINGLLIGAGGNGLLNVLKQFSGDNNRPFDWRSFWWNVAKGGVIGGAVGLVIGSVQDYYNGQIMPINTDKPIMDLINQNRLVKTDSAYKKLQEKANWIVSLLKSEYSEYLKTDPYYFGSTEKGIALRSNFDIDLAADFKNKSFSSTGELRDDILKFMKPYIGTNGLCRVRDQRVSIGLKFLIEGDFQRIDILPNKLSSNRINSSGYVYVNNNSFFQRDSYTKTNPKKLQSVPLSKSQKDILVALKIWKTKDNILIGSHMLQMMVLDAYDMNRGRLPSTLSEKIVLVLRHIVDNIDVPLCSIENTNNIVTDISAEKKFNIISACNKVIRDYEYQPNSILEHISNYAKTR